MRWRILKGAVVAAIGTIVGVMFIAGNQFITELAWTGTADPLWFHLWRGLWWFAFIGVVLLARHRGQT